MRFIQKTMKYFLLLMAVSFLFSGQLFFAVNAESEKAFVMNLDNIPTYTGFSVEIHPTISVDGVVLQENVDYVLAYNNNINATDKAEVVVTGIGAYDGVSSSFYFPILRVDIAEFSITVDDVTFTGGDLKPNIYIDNESISTDDYVVQYINNVEVGTGIVRVIGTGNYRGYKDVPFQIREATPGRVTLPSSAIAKEDGVTKDYTPYFVPAGTTLYASYSGIQSGKCLILRSDVNGSVTTVYSDYSFDGYYSYTCTEPGAYGVYLQYEVREFLGYTGYPLRPTYRVYDVERMYMAYCEIDLRPYSVIAGLPVEYGVREAYVQIESDDDFYAIYDAVWQSSDTSVATVKDGIVSFKTAGMATISATIGGETVQWEFDNTALDISKNTRVLFDENTRQYKVYWKDELLRENEDYTLEIENIQGINKVTLSGIHLFNNQSVNLFYKDKNITYVCTHDYDRNPDMYCDVCEEWKAIPGDMDMDFVVDTEDVVRLLLFISMPDMFSLPENIDADFTGDDQVTTEDAVTLLLHISMPDMFPLEVKKRS